mmetsp:Transcript_65071/g.146825  ORF Transcript_65071/g.146825 Transcript_65071/m.146825 type:complete len:234 (-) Transcript_65071:28-729(-)
MGQEFSLSSFLEDPALRVDVDFSEATSPPPRCQKTLDQCVGALQRLGRYSPEAEAIRQTITNPHDHNVAVATARALVPNVDTVAGWVALSRAVSEAVQDLTEVLALHTSLQSNEANGSLAGGPALTLGDLPCETLALASLVHFCWKFDTGKMIQPGVINDLAGYRRVVGKVDAAEVPGMTVDEAASSALRYMDIPGPTIATLTFFLLHGVLTEPQEQRQSAVLDGGTSTCVII